MLLDELEDMGAEVEDTLDRLMGDEDLYMEYVMQFPQNENIINLKNAVEAGDSDTAMKEVHTLKGVALNLGFLPLVDACMFMLMDFRSGKTEEAMEVLPDVEEQFEEFAKLIKKYEE